jgi:hypothetical protein
MRKVAFFLLVMFIVRTATADEPPKRNVKDFAPALLTKVPAERAKVLEAIGMLGKDAEPLTGDVIQGMLKHREQQEKYLACLKKINPRIWEPVSRLMTSPKDSFSAIQDLGRMKEKAEPAIPAIILQCSEGEQRFRNRMEALQALPKISKTNKLAIEFVLAQTTNKEVPVTAGFFSSPARNQHLAIKAMGEMDIEPKAKLKPLIYCAQSSDIEVSVTACGALGALGADAKPALPTLAKLTNSKNEQLRKVAEETIDTIKGAD